MRVPRVDPVRAVGGRRGARVGGGSGGGGGGGRPTGGAAHRTDLRRPEALQMVEAAICLKI